MFSSIRRSFLLPVIALLVCSCVLLGGCSPELVAELARQAKTSSAQGSEGSGGQGGAGSPFGAS